MSNQVEITIARLAATRDVIASLAADGDAATIGRKVLLLDYILAPRGTQRALAARLGVTPARACQMLRTLRRGLSPRV